MNIRPTLEEMAKIGFVRVNRADGALEIKNKSVSFVASESHDAHGARNGEWHWAGYSGKCFVAGWHARTILEAINTLIVEEKHLAYHEGKEDLRREIKELLGIKMA